MTTAAIDSASRRQPQPGIFGFALSTKQAWGLEGLARIKAFSRHPLVAIGGIHQGNVGAIVRAGAEGIAVVSAICGAEDPERAARDLVGGIRRAQA